MSPGLRKLNRRSRHSGDLDSNIQSHLNGAASVISEGKKLLWELVSENQHHKPEQI